MRRFFLAFVSACLLIALPTVSSASRFMPSKPGPLPDSALTPGEKVDKVTQNNVAQTICMPDYKVSNVSSKTKAKVFSEYHISKPDRSRYVIDHLIAVKVGGSNDVKNLWPQPREGDGNSVSKDDVEDQLNLMVCSGAVPLAVAQLAIAANWTTAGTAVTTTTTTTAPPPPPTSAAPVPPPNCNPNYSPCVPNASDVDCEGGSGNGPAYVRGPVRVIGVDVYDLDRDGDRTGCDT
jgi:hypothetical protein